MKLSTRIKFHLIKFCTMPYKKVKLHKNNCRFKDYSKTKNYDSYVFVDELPEKAVVFSFGIGDNIQFEKALLEDYPDISIYAFDPTPKSERYAKKLASYNNFHFEMTGLSNTDRKQKFYLPQNTNYISASTIKYDGMGGEEFELIVPMCKLSTLMNKYGINRIDLCKIDIEGEEFKAIPKFLKEGCFPKQICVELHERFYSKPLRVLKKFFAVMERYGYQLVYLSSSQEEFTFLKVR